MATFSSNTFSSNTVASNTVASNTAASVSIVSSGFTSTHLTLGNFETSSLFEPDVIIPGHFLSSDEGQSRGGERRLMAALLSDGIEAYINQTSGASVDSRRQKNKFDAAEWIESSDDSYVFSFDNVCRSLGINPHYLRLGLTRFLKSTKNTKVNETPVWKKIRRPRKRA